MEHLERLILDLKDSLERELSGIRQELADLNTRFDTQDARLQRIERRSD